MNQKDLLEPWRIAWIISESYREKTYAPMSFEIFKDIAERWAKGLETQWEDMKAFVPYPWVRDGVQAELAIREWVKSGVTK